MPSQTHEMLLLLFRNRPALAPELLREALNVELPTYSEVRLESAELSDVVSAVGSTAVLDEDTRVLYYDLIEAALGEAARKALQMLPRNYEFQGPTFKKGQLHGQTTAMASNILEILETRGLVVSDEIRGRVQSSTDLAQLRRWVRRAVVIGSVEELFEE